MRLWDYKLIPYLPKQMLVSQWRECIAIKRQWEKGTLKHRLVKYVLDYNKKYFLVYAYKVKQELENRNIKYNKKYFIEIHDFCDEDNWINISIEDMNYPEHNYRYLKQCIYNLQEKWDRGIISDGEWITIQDKFKDFI